MTAKNCKGPLPLVLAATGHRDLVREDEGQLRHLLADVFRVLQNRHPSTPLQLLSGLAEGADRLVAQIALDNQAELIAVLPMEQSFYEPDFESDESRREFRELLGRSTKIISLPLVEGNTRENIREQSRRDLQYEALGKYLISQCQILIALWDGNETMLLGGTSSIVNAQLGKKRGDFDFDPKHPLDDLETGPVYHIPTRRRSNPSPRQESIKWRVLYHSAFHQDNADLGKTYEQIYGRMDAFNKDAVQKFRQLLKERGQSADWLIPEIDRRQFAGTPLETMIAHYATADSLALHYQRRTVRSFKVLIFVCGLGGLLLFELFGHGAAEIRAPALFLYLLVISFAYTWYKLANFRELKTRHLDYRALAEGLRLQFFWMVAGVKEQVADHYLPKQKTELDWIRNAIRFWSEPLSALSIAPDLTLVRERWIDDQWKFFERAAGRNKKRHASELLRTRVLLFGLVAIALIAAGWTLLRWIWWMERFPDLPFWLSSDVFPGFNLHGLLVIVMTMLPAIAGAIAAYSLKMAFSEQRKQYDRMYRLHRRGAECLDQAVRQGNEALARDIIAELGKEALAENGDWVLLHRERKIEMPLSV